MTKYKHLKEKQANAKPKMLATTAIGGLSVVAAGPLASADTYTVKSGDTLGSIAQANNTTVETLVQLNNISNQNAIWSGESLNLPEAPKQIVTKTVSVTETYTVKSGDTLYQIAGQYNKTSDELAKENNITNPAFIQIGQEIKITTTKEVTEEVTTNDATSQDAGQTVSTDADIQGLVNTQASYAHPTYSSGNTYAGGNCTYYVKSVFGTQVGDYWGNALNWASSAAQDGFRVDNTPVAGSTIAVFQPGAAAAGGYGHVAVVVAVNGDNVTISEMNATAGLWHTNERVVPLASASYIHI